MVALSDNAALSHGRTAGNYIVMPDVTTGGSRAVYQQVGGANYLYYWNEHKGWGISTDYTSGGRGISSVDTPVECPEDEQRPWHRSRDGSSCEEDEFSGFGACARSNWASGGVAVTCPPPPPAPFPPPAPGLPPFSSASALETGVTVAIIVICAVATVIGIVACCVFLARRRKERAAGIPKIVTRRGALNAPGAWHFMISYTQRSDRGTLLATRLKEDLSHRGYSVWLDVKKKNKSEAAMEEAVKNSMVVLAVITGGKDDESAYLNRPFCQSELRWAFKADKHLQPIVHMDDKKKIGEFIDMAPNDLQRIGKIDFVDLNTTDEGYWSTGIDKVLEKAKEAGAFTSPAGDSSRSLFGRSSSQKLSSVAPKDTELTGPTAGAPALPTFDSVLPFSGS